MFLLNYSHVSLYGVLLISCTCHQKVHYLGQSDNRFTQIQQYDPLLSITCCCYQLNSRNPLFSLVFFFFRMIAFSLPPVVTLLFKGCSRMHLGTRTNTAFPPPRQAAIRKELNEFKSTEMEVHASSKHLTRSVCWSAHVYCICLGMHVSSILGCCSLNLAPLAHPQ